LTTEDTQPLLAADAALLALLLTHREATLLFAMAARSGATDSQIADALRQGLPHLSDPDYFQDTSAHIALLLTHREATILFAMAARSGATDSQIADALRQGLPHLSDPDYLQVTSAGQQSEEKTESHRGHQRCSCRMDGFCQTASPSVDITNFLGYQSDLPAGSYNHRSRSGSFRPPTVVRAAPIPLC
jgi:alkylhydroperoxidase/carboxymuconolactone decarboxylase family protein YurZ